MKKLILFLTTIPLISLAQDIRTVSGKQVDLESVHAWLTKPKREQKGERPLPHWKQVQILSVGQKVGSWQSCEVVLEGSRKPSTIFIEGLPSATIRAFQEYATITNAVEQLTTWLSTERKKLRQMDAELTGDGRHQYYLAQARYDNEIDRLAVLRRKQTQAADTLRKMSTELIMQSAKSYAGRDIWICGKP